MTRGAGIAAVLGLIALGLLAWIGYAWHAAGVAAALAAAAAHDRRRRAELHEALARNDDALDDLAAAELADVRADETGAGDTGQDALDVLEQVDALKRGDL